MAKQLCKSLAVKFPMAIFAINFGVRTYHQQKSLSRYMVDLTMQDPMIPWWNIFFRVGSSIPHDYELWGWYQISELSHHCWLSVCIPNDKDARPLLLLCTVYFVWDSHLDDRICVVPNNIPLILQPYESRGQKESFNSFMVCDPVDGSQESGV